MADQIPSMYGLESTAVDIYGTAISLLVITWTAALLRAYVRGFILRSVGWDDWTLIPTLVRKAVPDVPAHYSDQTLQVAFTTQCAYLLEIGDAEMLPDQHSQPEAISEVVTVSSASTASQCRSTTLTKPSPECGGFQWQLRPDMCLPQDLSWPLLLPNPHRAMATQHHLCCTRSEHPLRHHLFWHHHLRLWRPFQVPHSICLTSVYIDPRGLYPDSICSYSYECHSRLGNGFTSGRPDLEASYTPYGEVLGIRSAHARSRW